MPLDLTTDAEVFDGLETVTIEPRDASAGATVAGALRRAAERREADPSDGRARATDVVWHLPIAELATAPQLGAAIVDAAGVRWTVVAVERQSLGARWRCRTRNLAVAAGLDALVTLQRAVWTKDVAGAPVATWHDVRRDLPARIQPLETTLADQHDRPTARATHRVYLADTLDLDEHHRLVHDGQAYRILGAERADRLDALFVVHAAKWT